MQAQSASSDKPAQPSLSSALFTQFSDLIYDISGIRFAEAKAYFLSSKIWSRCQALGKTSFDEYLAYLKTPSARLEEYPHLIDQITINETFFFRNEPQLQSFEKDFLQPLILKRRQEGKNRIRIWSCAASTGDEAYTTALQILSLEGTQGMQFEIIGTDICRDAINKAKAGVYRKYGVRNIPPNLMSRYFTTSEDGQNFTISDDVKRMVTFQEGSLMDASRTRMLGKFDMAFCRNVLIYFDAASKEKVLTNIHSALVDDGFLFSGHSENLYSHRHLFRQVKEFTQAHAYIKAPADAVKPSV